MPNPIGLSFLPGEGGPQPKQPGGELGDAYKILSLQLPRMLGSKSMTNPQMGTLQPNMGNPQDEHHRAVFEALLKGMSGGMPY